MTEFLSVAETTFARLLPQRDGTAVVPGDCR
jgi:hypothetical protein